MKKLIYTFSVLSVGVLLGAFIMYSLMEEFRMETIQANKVGEMSTNLSSYLELIELEPIERKCRLSQWSHLVAQNLSEMHLKKGVLYEHFVSGEVLVEGYQRNVLKKFEENRPVLCN
ncbi:hypothetical protein [Teredinibacter sp. KSP-S5-2]|uniref:hypothetical protein n=1 Tax=Teredinibacter sp. KSP-S5-2 TaxID=3034506 RepID=UPI0029347318|nr:hypothetical protein [Teredinibacter sp. KSP-S5-2]WNO11179.1 hypothetical protein P5V12_08335 [Teredinibacter sp. KSP-S5-2]